MPEDKYTLGDFFSHLIGIIVLIIAGVVLLTQVYLYEQRTNTEVIGSYTKTYFEEKQMKTIMNKIGTILSQTETIVLIEMIIRSEVILSDLPLPIVEVRKHAEALGGDYIKQHAPNATKEIIDAVNELVLFEFEEIRKDLIKTLTEPEKS